MSIIRCFVLFCVLLFFISVVNSASLVFQDNTYKNSLRCCNATNCFILRDIVYVDNNTLQEFNIIDISNLVSCYEVENRLDVNISDAVFDSLNEIVLFGVIVFLFIGLFVIVVKKVRKE